ncbi:hypothetical protein [Pseudalkalibacillus decolorationis]|uniref:hypothetical protein n=1 Tax=Pseudalkalibacillus decolorationis TaxID=163879 RepID=UPI002148B9C4|nr:hypothetical protein [Pseudalkalibacillus decolorationis]
MAAINNVSNVVGELQCPLFVPSKESIKVCGMDVMSSSSAQVLEVASILPQTQKACYVAESPALVAPKRALALF